MSQYSNTMAKENNSIVHFVCLNSNARMLRTQYLWTKK